MKSIFNFCIVFSAFVTLSANVFGQSINDLDGTWMGSYTCRQGETGMRMRIQVKTDSTFVGTFEFFPICTNFASNVEIGMYFFTGTYDSNESINFDFVHWIFKPEGWTFVNKKGALVDKETLAGKVLDADCGDFYMKKMEDY